LDWLSVLVGLLGASLAFYTLSEGQKDSVESMMRSLQLTQLNVEWNDLWERVESGLEAAEINDTEVEYLRNRYAELRKRGVEVTALAVPEQIDEELRIKVYDESVGYFESSKKVSHSGKEVRLASA
jgi:hypothetical protein